MLSSETIFLLLPEITLIAVAVAIVMGGVFSRSQGLWSWLAAGGVIVAGTALWRLDGDSALSGPLLLDGLARYTRCLALTAGGLLVLFNSRPLRRGATAEYTAAMLLTVAGTMLVASAGNLVLLFVGLELISIPTYVLLYLPRHGAVSQEAAAKYFFLSILASAILLYGFSFLYGATGSASLPEIHLRLLGPAAEAGGLGGLAKIAGVLVFAGLGFKIAAVPFHFYAPDVYQGTSHANAALLSAIPKIAGFVALVRILSLTIPALDLYQDTWRIALALAVLTMTFGNFMALWQDNLRRLLAYSSIANSGYMLIALAVALAAGPGAPLGSFGGAAALLTYLAVYVLATIGAFAAVACLKRRDGEIEAVDELAGLGRTRPVLAAMLAIFMFSLAGIPPLVGFWGKFYVFGSAFTIGLADGAPGGMGTWFLALAVIGVLNAAVAAAYYLRVVAVMYFRMPLGSPQVRTDTGIWATVLLCGALVVGLGLWPRPLLTQADRAGRVAAGAGSLDNPQVSHSDHPKPGRPPG